jgi:TolA-binding protein/uncharacterized protein YdbL (DUF1318 family)
MSRRDLRLLVGAGLAGALLTVLLAVTVFKPGTSARAPAGSALTAQSLRDKEQDGTIQNISDRVGDLHDTVELVLVPISLLVGILALGGVLGVVFSIRDQARAGQLHELAVTSGMAAERRADQSFTSFFEGSQRTLSLVNDTLAVAKEASESAAHTMQTKASSNLQVLEEQAEDLILQIAEEQNYEEIIDLPQYRAEVESIAKELDSLEGYLRLQDIPIKPYCWFVRGVERYLKDDMSGALHAFRDVSQLTGYPQLVRFAYYWLGQLHAVLGEYEKASQAYKEAVAGLRDGSGAKLELDRALAEVDFLKFAAASSAATPHERWKEVQRIGTKLEGLLQHAKDQLDDQHIVHQIESTLANVYTWVAYDPVLVHEPIAKKAVKAARKLPAGQPPSALKRQAQRAWAIQRARDVYPDDPDLHLDESVDFLLRFGMAECGYWLSETSDIKEYREVLHAAVEGDQTAHREHRKLIEIAQVAFVAQVRLLHHARETSPEQVATAEGAVSAAFVRFHEELGRAKDEKILFFSQLQRRNVDRRMLADEVSALLRVTIGPQQENPG